MAPFQKSVGPTAKLTQRVSLAKSLSMRHYLSLAFGVIIGVGWVVFATRWIVNGGWLGAVLAFAIGAAVMIPLGRCYSELTAAMPVSGGAVAFVFKAFGPFAAFLAAWALTLKYIAVTAFETVAIGQLIEPALPFLRTEPLYEVQGYGVSITNLVAGIGVGLWVIWINWRGVKQAAIFQMIVVAALLISTALFAGLAFINGDIANLKPVFANMNGETGFAAALSGIAAVLVTVPFFLAGFDTIPQAAEEAGRKMRAKDLGAVIMISILAGVAFYLVIIMTVAISSPRSELIAIIEAKEGLPMVEVFENVIQNKFAANLVLFAALMGLISTLNGVFIGATRILFAQGRGGLLPEWFSALHPRHHTPANAILFVGAIAVAAPFFGYPVLSIVISGNSLIFTAILLTAAVSALQLRKTAPDMARPIKVSNATLILAIFLGGGLVALMLVPGSPGRIGATQLTLIGGWTLLGVAFYFLRARFKGALSYDEQARLILGEH